MKAFPCPGCSEEFDTHIEWKTHILKQHVNDVRVLETIVDSLPKKEK